MNSPQKLLLLFSILPFTRSSEEPPNPASPENPRILEFPQIDSGEILWSCSKWRAAVEENDLGPWKTIPAECGEYVQEYMMGQGYEVDVERVSEEAGMYARSVNLSEDGRDAWIFDVDETLLSNLPYYAQNGFGSQIFDSKKFDEWVEMGMAPAIPSSLKLYEEVMNLGFAVIFLTGRRECHRSITIDNLHRVGFYDWRELVMRSSEDRQKTAMEFKSSKRKELEEEGYRILGNSGDQWSDLLGSSTAERSFKLSNLMYYIS